MKIILGKIYRASKSFSKSLRASIDATLEELRTILRNRRYQSEYPKLFAMFSILEHEQSAAVFDVNEDDFKLIKDEVLRDPNANSSQVLDALRSLFQNTEISDKNNETKNQIAKYLHDELVALVKKNNGYYFPLIKALIQGFPFILNYNHYELFKILLKQKSRKSYKLIKHILDKDNFYNFFLRKQDAINSLAIARDFDNKIAYLLLVRFLRKNNLFENIYDHKICDMKMHIINITAVKKRGIEYSAIMLSYLEDNMLNEHMKAQILQFFEEIFSYHLGLKQKQKQENYAAIIQMIVMAKRIGYNNSLLLEMLDNAANRFIDRRNDKSTRSFKRYLKKMGPATSVKIRDFFAMAPLSPEEYLIIKYAPYLL